jgi:molybdate transport system substrate-binding protein
MRSVENCRRLWFFLCFGLLAGCANPKKESIAVFAAASTREVMEQIATDFEAETGLAVVLNFGPSSGLARQIEQGANADLFLSADESWADSIAAEGLVDRRRDLLANKLVIVLPAESSLIIKDLSDLAKPEIRRLALASSTVPAGMYARKAFQSAGLWEQVKDRVVEGSDVRAALAYVSRGEVEAGIVYATDAAGSNKVRVALEIEPKLHPPIRYPLVLIKRDSRPAAALSFYDYLESKHAAEIFVRAGFGVVR